MRFASTAIGVPQQELPQNSVAGSSQRTSDGEISVDDFSELATSEEVRKKIHLILLEYVNCRETIGRVPSTISQRDMTELLEIRSPMGRAKYFNYLFKKQMSDIALKRRREEKRLERLAAAEEKRRKAEEDGSIRHIQYGIGNTIFLFIRDTNMSEFYNYRQMYAALFGQIVVFDLDYESIMRKRELINAADQLQEVYGANKVHPDPFNIVFCNLKPDSEYKTRLLRSLPHLEQPTCLLTSTEKSYLDIYPRNRLVYLTPDAKAPLKYDHDDIYIIGGIVDKTIQKPVSLARAKREGLRMARLPLDEYLPWGSSASKSLPLNVVINILLEMKATGDWSKAFRFVPTRKLKSAEELESRAKLEKVKEKKKMRVLAVKSAIGDE